MGDLRTRFQKADLLAAPDLWAEIEGRVERERPEPPMLRRVTVAGVALLLFAGAALLLWTAFRGGQGRPRPGATTPAPNPSVGATIELDERGRAVAAGEGAWVSTRDRLVYIDPETGKVRDLAFGQGPFAVTFAGDSVWVAGFEPGEGPSVRRVEVPTGGIAATIPFGEGLLLGAIDGDEDAVWVVATDNDAWSHTLVRIDPQNDAVVARIPLGGPRDDAPPGSYRIVMDLDVGEGLVWVDVWDMYEDQEAEQLRTVGASLIAIDPTTNRVVQEFEIPNLPTIVVGHGAIWGSLGSRGTIRIEPTTGETSRIDLADFLQPFAIDVEGVWLVGRRGDGEVDIARLNPETSEVAVSIGVLRDEGGRGTLVDAAIDESRGDVWVLYEDGTVVRVDLR